ncbi:hypothetical protein HAX54_001706 [Datura stramonium]|uniref:Di19 zinc-binding domain-containing protein n=1 Tax=Datura stramonium TaxID=4076 RepID=A0ABS8T3X9_DATST|nr:hypothetical protein [Datura stramonium]
MDDRDDDLKILLSALKDGGVYVEVEEDEEEEEEEEEEEGDDEDVNDDNVKTDLACPFCSEDFDMLGLCCHIDSEHRIEAKTGVNHAYVFFRFHVLEAFFALAFSLIIFRRDIALEGFEIG